MSVKVTGVAEVGDMILRVESEAKKRVVKFLIRKGKEVQELAILMAPVEHQGLEKAIKMTPSEYGGRERDETGRFTKTEITVYVDSNSPSLDPERPGETVREYAYEMHEHLTPVGELNLGKLSKAKQESSPSGIQVGGAYMTRAGIMVEKKMDPELAEILASL